MLINGFQEGVNPRFPKLWPNTISIGICGKPPVWLEEFATHPLRHYHHPEWGETPTDWRAGEWQIWDLQVDVERYPFDVVLEVIRRA